MILLGSKLPASLNSCESTCGLSSYCFLCWQFLCLSAFAPPLFFFFCSSLLLRQLEGHLLYEISPTHSFSSPTPRSLSPFDLLHTPWILASSCQEHFSVLACPPALGAQPNKSTEGVRFTLKLRSESVQLEELGMLFDLLNYLISLSYTDFKKKEESSSSFKK